MSLCVCLFVYNKVKQVSTSTSTIKQPGSNLHNKYLPTLLTHTQRGPPLPAKQRSPPTLEGKGRLQDSALGPANYDDARLPPSHLAAAKWASKPIRSTVQPRRRATRGPGPSVPRATRTKARRRMMRLPRSVDVDDCHSSSPVERSLRGGGDGKRALTLASPPTSASRSAG